MLDKHMLISGTRADADCTVVNGVTEPGMRNLWVAVLYGIPLVSERAVLHSLGPVVQYQRAIGTARQIWVSPAFRAVRPAIFKLTEQAVADRRGKWKLITGDFTKFRVARRKRHTNARALVTKRQLKEHGT